MLLLLVVTLTLPPAPPAAARPDGPLVPERGALVGAYFRPPSGWSREATIRQLRRRERYFGRKVDIFHWYYSFGKTFPTWRERWNLRRNRRPMISWGGTDVRTINSGAHDALIRARANGVRRLRKRVFVRFLWEMEGYHLHQSIAPRPFKRAWRRVVRTFDERGARNAVWVWCPTAWGFAAGKAQRFYPGDRWVDWVCADGYNWAGVRSGERSHDVNDIFKAAHRFSRRHGKPMMVGEWGAVERAPGAKARWFRRARHQFKRDLRHIAALVYFDTKRTGTNWRVDSSSSSYAAYRELVRDPYYDPRKRVAR